MRDVFDDSMIAAEDYEHLVPEMRNDAGDRHVLAAAAAAHGDVIVTSNVRHFPHDALTGLPVGRVMTPDTFMCELYRAHPLLVDVVIDRVVARKERPRITHLDLVDRLVGAGALGFAERLGLLVPAIVSP
jgi:hypothetical protein